MSSEGLVRYTGGCHCGAVKYEVKAPETLTVFDCNCSICTKKQNRHFIVPHSKFKLLQGEQNLTEYKFQTKKARHLFCKTCGVQSFYQPRSNPDGYGVMPHCLDPWLEYKITGEKFDGQNWEQAYEAEKEKAKTSGGIMQHSKE